MTGTLSAFTSLGVYGYPIPERSEATPGLFNQIFSGLSANLDRLNSDVSNIVGSSVGTTESVLGFSSNTLRPESGNTLVETPSVSSLLGTLSVVSIQASGNTLTLLAPMLLGRASTFSILETVRFTDQYPGSTLTARIQAALSDLTSIVGQGLVIIPANESTADPASISLTSVPLRTAILDLRNDGTAAQLTSVLLSDCSFAARNTNGPQLLQVGRTFTNPGAAGAQAASFFGYYNGIAGNALGNPLVGVAAVGKIGGAFRQTVANAPMGAFEATFATDAGSAVSVDRVRLYDGTFALDNASAGTINTIVNLYAQNLTSVPSGLTINNAYGVFSQNPAGGGLVNVAQSWAAWLDGRTVINADGSEVSQVGLRVRGLSTSRTTDLFQVTDSASGDALLLSVSSKGKVGINVGSQSNWLYVNGDTVIGADGVAASAVALRVRGNLGTRTADLLQVTDSNNGDIATFSIGTRGQSRFTDGVKLSPAIQFLSENSLGLYVSTASTLALSYGTLDLTGAVASFGSLKIKAGANQSCGTAVLGSNGSVNVANTYVKTGDLIFLTDQTPGGTLGDLEIGGIRNSSGFTITSTSVTDTSTVAWLIVRPG